MLAATASGTNQEPDHDEPYGEDGTVTAFAILGNTPVDRVIAHTLLRLGPPKCPAKYFTDEEEAVIWLRTNG